MDPISQTPIVQKVLNKSLQSDACRSQIPQSPYASPNALSFIPFIVLGPLSVVDLLENLYLKNLCHEILCLENLDG